MAVNKLLSTVRRYCKYKINDIKDGFTLAEVLITLVIIGVIAAMTIPTLMNNTSKQEYVSKLKKAYSTLSQATTELLPKKATQEVI